MLRIALLSDIHGNSIALSAVLEDIKKQGDVHAYWVLGDLVAIGHDPIRVLEALNQLPNVEFIHGNTDRYLVTGERPLPPQEEMCKNPGMIPSYLHVIGSFAWTQGALTLTGWMPFLQDLPLELRRTLPDGTRFLGVHASPGTDDGLGFGPDTGEEKARQWLKKTHADLIVVGHTHWPMEFELEGVRIFNLGSVSNPMPPDLRAKYAILEAGENGFHLERRFVEYDHQAVIEAVTAVKHPAAQFIIDYQLGKNLPRWEKNKQT
jgi:predicted phosphodiesterase